MNQIPDKLYFKIGSVSGITGVKPHILRYWENELRIINPRKSGTNQRVYTRRDVKLILEIKRLLESEKYTLEGVKKRIMEKGAELCTDIAHEDAKHGIQSTLQEIKDELYTIKNMLSAVD